MQGALFLLLGDDDNLLRAAQVLRKYRTLSYAKIKSRAENTKPVLIVPLGAFESEDNLLELREILTELDGVGAGYQLHQYLDGADEKPKPVDVSTLANLLEGFEIKRKENERLNELAGMAFYLELIGEPPVEDLEPGLHYRFLWLRSFHPPIVVRASLTETFQGLVFYEFEREPEDFRRVRMLNQGDAPLDDSSWTETADAFEAMLKLCPELPPKGGIDGATWIFQSNKAGPSRTESIWSPGTDDFHDFARNLLARTTITADEIY